MKNIDKLTSKQKSKIGMLTSASKGASIKFAENVYTFSLIRIGWTNWKVALKSKREYIYLNLSPISEIFIGMMMLSIEE